MFVFDNQTVSRQETSKYIGEASININMYTMFTMVESKNYPQ